MSEVAGPDGSQIRYFLTKRERRICTSWWWAFERKVTIIGGGVVGTHAARIALGLGAQMTILDISKRLSVRRRRQPQIQTLMSIRSISI